MDVTQLSKDWASWVNSLRQAFPHARLPDIFPRAEIGDALVQRIADAHDLTTSEVREIIEDLVLIAIAQDQAA